MSTILIVGGSGDYFDVADQVLMMDEYVLKDVTQHAKTLRSQTVIKEGFLLTISSVTFHQEFR